MRSDKPSIRKSQESRRENKNKYKPKHLFHILDIHKYLCLYNHYTALFTTDNNQSSFIPQSMTPQFSLRIFTYLGINFQDSQIRKSESVRENPMSADSDLISLCIICYEIDLLVCIWVLHYNHIFYLSPFFKMALKSVCCCIIT